MTINVPNDSSKANYFSKEEGLLTKTTVNDYKWSQMTIMIISKGDGGCQPKLWGNDYKQSQMAILKTISKGEVCQHWLWLRTPNRQKPPFLWLRSMIINGPKWHFLSQLARGDGWPPELRSVTPNGCKWPFSCHEQGSRLPTQTRVNVCNWSQTILLILNGNKERLSTQTLVYDFQWFQMTFLMSISIVGGLPTQVWVCDSKWSQTTFLMPVSREWYVTTQT